MTKYAFENGFPKGYGHTSVSYLKQCTGYEEAKNGNLTAAKSVVLRCIKWKQVKLIQKRYPYALLIPVISKNILPLTFAKHIGLPVYTEVKLAYPKERKKSSAMERLLTMPLFHGHIPPFTDFIIVDDIVTQGGTVAALRNYIISQGSCVIAVIALAYSAGSFNIAPKQENAFELMDKFGCGLLLVLHIFGIVNDFHELTNSQMVYLLRFKHLKNILAHIEKSQKANKTN